MSLVKNKNDLFFEDLEWLFKCLWMPIPEIYWGIKKSVLPTTQLLLWAIIFGAAMNMHLDSYFFKLVHAPHLCATGHLRTFITVTLMWGGFWVWGLHQVSLRRQLMAKLTLTFINADLLDKNGRLPSYVFDRLIDRDTRRLRIKNVGHTVKKFKDVSESLEAGLGVKIVKIEEVPRSKSSLIDIIYAHEELDKDNKLGNIFEYDNYSFPVGNSRTGHIVSNFTDVPHLIAAGATGTGKSTFLKMLATVIVANNKTAEVVFIDPKGSESTALEKFYQVKIVRHLGQAKEILHEINEKINYRNQHFTANGVKDLIAYNKLPFKLRKSSQHVSTTSNLNRIIVIVDEFSDFMRTHTGIPQSDLTISRQIMNRIAQMGRSCGIHIVIGVQNPDKKNIDLGLKANLIGTLCFPVRDHVASTVILGNRRAADLPNDMKGRAIWQLGAHQEEVQVPYITDDEIQLVAENLKGKSTEEAK